MVPDHICKEDLGVSPSIDAHDSLAPRLPSQSSSNVHKKAAAKHTLIITMILHSNTTIRTLNSLFCKISDLHS